jgi:hypothetical protein
MSDSGVSDSEVSDVESEIETPDLDTYSDTEKLIGKFHATMSPLFLGFTDEYAQNQGIFSYYEGLVDEFNDEIPNINTVTVTLNIPKDESMEYTVITVGLSYQEIYDKLKIYRIMEDVHKITFDEGRNLTVSSY